MNATKKEQLDQLFSLWNRGLCPGAQVLIRQHGETIYEECFGYGNLENQLKITKDSIFHVASISKEFTVLAILLLWKDGKLNLDDDVREYLPELVHVEPSITIRQMMNNVSGLRDQWELLFMRSITINDKITMEDVNTSIKLQKRLNFEPQSQYLYSNTGFHLLALIVEKLSGMSFPQFAKERIFDPLGMTHTFARESFTQVVPNLVYSYQDEGDGNFYYNPLNYCLYGPTSVNTCASDMYKMLDEYLNPQVFDPEILSLMKTPAILSNGTACEYCGGLMTHKLHGLDVFGHGGADAAYRGQVSFIPEEELEIILFSNTTTYPMGKLADQVACIVLGLENCTEPVVPEHTNVSAREGVFMSYGPVDPMIVQLTERDGTIYMTRELCDTTPLVPEADGGYRVGTLDEIIYFTEDGILYRLPGRTLKLSNTVLADPACFEEGVYYDEETDAYMKLVKTEDRCEVHMTRFGKTTLYQNDAGDIGFTYDPNFTMFVTVREHELYMEGNRIRRIVAAKL